MTSKSETARQRYEQSRQSQLPPTPPEQPQITPLPQPQPREPLQPRTVYPQADPGPEEFPPYQASSNPSQFTAAPSAPPPAGGWSALSAPVKWLLPKWALAAVPLGLVSLFAAVVFVLNSPLFTGQRPAALSGEGAPAGSIGSPAAGEGRGLFQPGEDPAVITAANISRLQPMEYLMQPCSDLVWSPDGQYLLTVHPLRGILLLDSRTLNEVQLVPLPGEPDFLADDLAFSTGGDLLFLLSDQKVSIWKYPELVFLQELPTSGYAASADSSLSGETISVAYGDHVDLFQRSGDAFQYAQTIDRLDSIIAAPFHPNGSQILVENYQGHFGLIDLASGETIRKGLNHNYNPFFFDGGRQAYIPVPDSDAVIITRLTGDDGSEITLPSEPFAGVFDTMAVSRDGSVIAFRQAGILYVYNLAEQRMLAEIDHWEDDHFLLAPDASTLLTFKFSDDANHFGGPLTVWEIPGGQKVLQKSGFSHLMPDLMQFTASDQVILMNRGSHASAWNVADGLQSQAFDEWINQNQFGSYYDITASENGLAYAITGDGIHTIVYDGKSYARYLERQMGKEDFALSPDGLSLVTRDDFGTLSLHHLTEGSAEFILQGVDCIPCQPTFSPDGKGIALLSPVYDGQKFQHDKIEIARLRDSSPFLEIPAPDGYNLGDVFFFQKANKIGAFTYHIDGSDEKSILIWDTKNGDLLQELKVPYSRAAFGYAPSNQGSLLAVITENSVQIHEAGGDLLTEIPALGSGAAAFSFDGTRLAISDGNGVVLWGVE